MKVQQLDLTALTVRLLTGFVTNNPVRRDDLSALIASTHAALLKSRAKTDHLNRIDAESAVAPAVAARRSLANRDFIISLIDGKPYKSLKRHLTSHGLTPQAYRARYGLAETYPMVAPAYSDARSVIAKSFGLGRKTALPASSLLTDGTHHHPLD